MSACGFQHFSFVNCIEKTGKYNKADVRLDMLKTISSGYNYILALGNFVSESLETIDLDHFKAPHPSGLNRLLNDKNYEHDMLDRMKRYLND